MAHLSGNATWVDYPSTATLITAPTLEALEGGVDNLPRGIVGRRTRTTNATNTVAGAEQMVMWAAASVLSGRLYRISAPSLGVYGSASNGFAIALLRVTTDGTTVPSSASTQIGQAVAPLPLSVTGYAFDVTSFYAPGSNLSLRVGLSYTGSPANNATMQGSVAFPIFLVIEDVGLAISSSGADL